LENKTSFSIIIPVQNGAKTIERLFGSLISQKELIHEVLVCNDQSTDDTVAIAEQYKGMLPIKVIDVPKEIGNNPGRARQCGLDQASGDWVVFADADDLLSASAVWYYNKIISDNPEAKMICAALDEIRASDFHPLEHLAKPYAWVHAKAFNLGYIREHGIRFHDTLYTHEDKFFVLLNLFDMVASESKVIAEDVTTYYWMRSENTMVSRDKGKYPIKSHVDAMDATIIPCEMVAKKYGLTQEKVKELFGESLFSCITDDYSKIQASVFKWGREVLDESNILKRVPKRVQKISQLTGWTYQDFLNIAWQDANRLVKGKNDSVRTIGEFVPSQTFSEYLTMMRDLADKVK
jgi:glycosyltransferase involved in cell wall biosynthesis